MWTRIDILLWPAFVSLFGAGRESTVGGLEHFGSFEPLQLIARGGNLSDVKFTQRNGKLVSG